MKRRKFVKNFSAGAGGIMAGMDLVGGNSYDFSKNTPSAGNDLSANASKPGMVGRSTCCQLKKYKGKPTVFINGKPYFPLAYLSQFPEQFRYKNMRDSGIRFIGCYISLGDRFPGLYKNQKVRLDKYNIWYAPGKVDYEIFDRSINEILEIAPDAYLLPRISCNSPSWWDSYNPAETCRTYKEGLPQCQSFSSIVWRKDTAEVLRKIVRHISRSWYADRFIGMHICVGETNESVHLGWLGDTDYSIVAQNGFIEWLLHRYNNDHDLVQKHFNKPIDQISIPTPVEREKTEFGDFFDPEKSRLNIDYRFFRCEEIVASLHFLCKAVKEESNGNLLTGTFYGHTFTQWLDHMAFSQALDSPYIDFFTSTTWGTEIDSIKKANKLFYNEGDEKTCLGKWISETRPDVDPYHAYDLPVWKRPGTLEQTLEHLKSEFTHAVCTGTAIYWYDLWGGWYDHGRILNLFSEMQTVANESVHLPGSSVSQVGLIVDEKSFLYVSTLRRQWVNDISWIGSQKAHIDKFGAPYDIYLLDDLKDLDISKYKMIIFLNTFVLKQEERQTIFRKCMRDNRVLLWLYAPGLISDKISIDNVSSLVNMEIGYEENRPESEIDVNIKGNEMSYKGSKVSPFIHVKSGADKINGYTKDGYAVLAEKKEKNCTNVIACIPPVPWQLIQYYSIKGGVHIYSEDGDVVYANESYLSIKAAKPGKKLIHLPGKTDLMELLDSDNNFKSGNFKSGNHFEVDVPETGSVKFFKVY